MGRTVAKRANVSEQRTRGEPLRQFFSRLFREKKLGALGLIIVLAFLLVGIFSDVIATHGMLDHNLDRRLEGPSLDFPLGTDQYGRDQFSRIVHGARISMIVGVAASAISVIVASVFGLLLGYWGGTVDLIAQRVVDAVQSFPWLFLVITVMSLLGPGIVQVIIIVLGVPWGIVNIRTVRSVVLSVKETAYVEAARAVGGRTWRVLVRHVAPQIMAPMIVLFTVSLGGNVIGEASVSFLGFGIPPPHPSWGGMLSLEGRTYLLQAPLLAFWPRSVPGPRRVRRQHVRRRAARSARSAPARRRRTLRNQARARPATPTARA